MAHAFSVQDAGTSGRIVASLPIAVGCVFRQREDDDGTQKTRKLLRMLGLAFSAARGQIRHAGYKAQVRGEGDTLAV